MTASLPDPSAAKPDAPASPFATTQGHGHVWECERGHRCAISTAAMVQRITEPRCEVVTGHHGRTQNDRYAWPYYEGAPVLCDARLVKRVAVLGLGQSGDAGASSATRGEVGQS